MLVQLELFHEKTEIEILEEQIRMLEKSLDKQRKAQFAQIGAISKKYMELNERFNILERVICKGKYDGLF